MKQTRFMQVMFSAVEKGDEELAAQVAGDIEEAKENGGVDTDELEYANLGEGKVMITDKENGEVTIAQVADDEAETYDLIAVPTEEMEKFLHTIDGTTPNEGVKTEVTEDVNDHLEGAEPMVNPQTAEEAGEEKQFSVTTNNSVVMRVFSDQEFCERIFSEVIESEQTAVVGNLKVEKCADEDGSVIVTDNETGDQIKVDLDDDNLSVTELDQKEFKNFSDEEEDELEDEEYEPMFVVGFDPINHIIVDAPVYSVEEAEKLAARLNETGVIGVELFEDPDDAREKAASFLSSEGITDLSEQVDEPEQVEFSDTEIWVTRYFSDCTKFMFKLFSEAEEEASESQSKVEEAISTCEKVETDDEIITPIDNKTAVIEDKETGEFTKATLEDEDVNVEKISEGEANELLDEYEEDVPEEKEFSDFTQYMIRLYSDIASTEEVEDAIESGEQIENDTEIITPVDDETAVIEDKVTGEFTKASLDGENLKVDKISEEEADELTSDLEVEDKNENEDEKEAEEKTYSDQFGVLTKFFSDGNTEKPSTVEEIEDKALAAVKTIQEVADQSVAAIEEAKEAPVEEGSEDLKEATFSDKTQEVIDPVLGRWMRNFNK